jgi:hypothetical protein
MYPIEPILPILASLDRGELTPQAFGAACAIFGWSRAIADGVGLWEARHPTDDTRLILDTVIDPVTLLCRLDDDDDDDREPAALLDGELRRRFDVDFLTGARLLGSVFPESVGAATHHPPYHWRFAHFRGRNSRVALEQSDHDPLLGVQLLLILQPFPADPTSLGSAISAAW